MVVSNCSLIFHLYYTKLLLLESYIYICLITIEHNKYIDAHCLFKYNDVTMNCFQTYV